MVRLAPPPATPPRAPANGGASSRTARRRAILEIIEHLSVGSQEELAVLLRERGFTVTQATVSRDVADLGIVKAPRGDRHVYATPRSLDMTRRGTAAPTPGAVPQRGELARLRRILGDHPVTVARSGLVLVLVGDTGSAMAVAQAIDESDLSEQVGTLAGDNTVLVLFADEPGLERWRTRFEAIRDEAAAVPAGEADLTSTYP